MLVPYDITAPNLGAALAMAQQRAYADRWAHIDISSIHRSGEESWMIVIESVGNNGPLSGE